MTNPKAILRRIKYTGRWLIDGFLERRLLVDFGLWRTKQAYGTAAVPVNRLMKVRRWTNRPDGLYPRLYMLSRESYQINNGYLASRLPNVTTSVGSLDSITLNFLEDYIKKTKPQLILEFGSGFSTTCLVQYMREIHADQNRLYVISIEQDTSYVASTTQLLEKFELQKYARVIYAPLRKQTIENIETTCYDLNESLLKEVFGDLRPDFILVDGPAGEPAIRFATLPLTHQLLAPSAKFFLDDALRDGELKVAALWQSLPYIQIEGLHLIGKGLLAGSINV